jgi:hypothetical protein
MKKIVLFLLMFIPVLVSAQITDAQIYHDKLVDETRNVAAALNKFNTSLETDSAYLMHGARAGLKKQLDSSIAHLALIGGFNGDDDWCLALNLQFKFYRECVDKEYIKFIDYSLRLSVLNEDEIADFRKTIEKLNSREIDLSQIEDMAYSEFVKKYKVKPAEK